MNGFDIFGAIVGGLIGWVVGVIFSKGPKTPIEAASGDYERGGPGLILFLLLVIGGALVGGYIAPSIFK